MMKSRSIARAPRFCSAVCLALTLAACGKSGGSIPFDGEKAPYGPKTTTTRLQSILTISSGLLPATSRSQDTAVVGQKAIGTVMYDRLATVRSDDPSKGGEYWIKENSNGTLDFAGFMHTDLLSGVLPSGSTTFTTPIRVNLDAPVGQAQPVTATGTVAAGGSSAPSSANFNGQYTLTEKNATVASGIGPLSGCNHYAGSATSDSAEIPALLQGITVNAELWYHPSYGVVAFNSPTLGLGTAMTGSEDCGSIDSSNFRIIRKVGVVDSTTSFNLNSFSCDGNQTAADKNTHAKMLLELRWVDEAAGKTDVQPMPVVEFGTGWGYFPNAMNETPASVFHPEESGKGFKYWYSYVDQAAKNEPGTSTSYHIKVTGVAGLLPVRVTARIYYKVIPSLVGPGPDAAVLGGNRDSGADTNAVSGNRDGGSDQIAGGNKDVAGGASDAKDSSLADVATDVVGGRTEGGTDAIGAATGCNLIANGNAESAIGSTDGAPVPTPGWTSTGEATAGQYGAPYGYPGPTDPGPPDRGNNLFAGGVADEISTLTQTVNVSQYASAIDTSGVSYLLSGWLGGWDGQDDNAVLTVTFQSASGSALGTGTIGPVLSSDRSGVSGLFFRSTSGAVPSGTRTALIVLTLTRTSGTNNDSYADNLSLALSGAGIPTDACSPVSAADAGSDGGKDTAVATGGTDGGVPPDCGAATPCATVIHSTTGGGTWSDTSTWVEKVVPTAANDVEISGPVVIAAEAPCNNLTIKSGGLLQNVGRGDPYGPTPTTINGNLTIEAGGTLTNEPGYRSRIVVMGNCANGGTIKNSTAGVLLEVKKSFAQNGTYEGPSITFNGGTDQTISCGAGKKIVGSITVSNPAKSIKATSDMYLEDVTVALSDTTSQGTFDMNGFKLFVSGGPTALITDDTSNHAPRIKYTNIAGINCADGAMIYESSFANSSAPITIDGVLTTCGRGAGGTQVTFDGDLTVNAGATMQNELGYHSGVVVTGSLVNNGSVSGRSGGYGFEVKKNFTQNNVYTATETTFSGAGVETISMGAGKKIAGTIFLANAKSGGTLKALSDLTVENVTFTVGDATTNTAIDMSQNKLVLVGGANALVCDDTSNHLPRVTFTNIGGITGASLDTATDPMIWESSFENTSGTITLAGQFRTVGRGAGGTQIRFTGNVVLAAGAVWRNEAGYRSGITISGSFTKNGTAVSDGGANLLVINDTAY